MKRFFAWQALRPPAADVGAAASMRIWADGGAVLLLILGLLQLAFGLEAGLLQLLPLIVGLLLFGLPHGAIDHLVALGLAGRAMRPRPLGLILLLYLVLVVAVIVLWLHAPFLAATGFLLMTLYHWGKADVAFEHLFYEPVGRRGRRALEDWIHLLLRGLIPVGLPFLAFPDQAVAFINGCIHLFSPELQPSWSFLRRVLLVVFVSLFMADALCYGRRWRAPSARRVLLENVALTAFFWQVTPLVAIGWYFAGWHGYRHFLRLCRYEPVGPSGNRAIFRSMRRRIWQALPFTIISVLMLLALYGRMQEQVSDPFAGAALYLVLISALTLPHLVVVEWMDHSEGRGSLSGWMTK